jgi:hypothetical protein
VVTEWRNTSFLGDEWAFIPAEIEDMSPVERNSLAKRQKNIYIESMPNANEVLKKLENSIVNAIKTSV